MLLEKHRSVVVDVLHFGVDRDRSTVLPPEHPGMRPDVDRKRKASGESETHIIHPKVT